jgi:hypothetical protein
MIEDKHFKPFTQEDVAEAYRQRRIAYARNPDPHHRKILRNYLLHAMLELSGRYDEIFSPELTVAEPEYEYFQSGAKYHGGDAVKGMYRGLTVNGATAIIADQQRVAVADWGFCTEQVSHYYLPPQLAEQRGLPVNSERDFFVEHRPLVMVWLYDAQARLMGERIYHAATSTYSRLRPEQFLTTEDVAQALAPLIPLAEAEFRANPETLPV